MTMTEASSINLASQPFRKERALNAVYALLCVGLICSFLVLTSLALSERGKAARERQTIDAETAQLRGLRQRQAQYQSVLLRPQNADVFAVSVFLNQLIARRAVSWTGVFRDMATVLPNDVRLEVIRLPQLPSQDASGTNRVRLDMVVETTNPEQAGAFLRRLEESPLFGPATLMSQTPPTQNDSFFKFRVAVSYAQRF